MKKINLNKRNNKNGFAIIWSLVMALIILIMASSMAILIVKELRITSNIDESNRAYMAAESGMERALYYIKNSAFGWCGPNQTVGPTTIDTNLVYRYTIRAVASATGCDSITIESTGTENLNTHRKIKLSIVYGPNNKIERFDSAPAWSSFNPTRNYYTFPASSLASDKPLIVQQFDIWDITSASVGQQYVIGMSSGNNNNDFGTKITKISSGTAQLSLTGRINGVSLVSNTQNFSISGNPGFRIVSEYSRVSNNYSVVRSIVLLRDIASGEEKYYCPNSIRSYVVYGAVNSITPDPTLVKVGYPNPSIPAPNWTSASGNGYLQYPSGVKIDNMVFWGRE
jgi:Tfp pilus assembly protein PilX